VFGEAVRLKWHIRCLSRLPPSTVITFPKKILLIDREPGVTRLIKRALEKTGKYWIKEEHDSEFALQSARWFQPDLILLDTMTTSPDREQLAKRMQTDTALRATPLVCLSSLKPESQMVSGGILSGYSFFAAPIRVEEVLRGVEQLLFGKD
jgi:two-component system alkaline phosphatase synthesis response regulator PhoP